MEKLMPLLRSVESGSYLQKVKVGCELLGIPVGIPRQPLLPLTAEDRAEFEKIFRNSVG
jgi:4-hydroxy-tetrahydrodipicolinate synthase